MKTCRLASFLHSSPQYIGKDASDAPADLELNSCLFPKATGFGNTFWHQTARTKCSGCVPCNLPQVFTHEFRNTPRWLSSSRGMHEAQFFSRQNPRIQGSGHIETSCTNSPQRAGCREVGIKLLRACVASSAAAARVVHPKKTNPTRPERAVPLWRRGTLVPLRAPGRLLNTERRETRRHGDALGESRARAFK